MQSTPQELNFGLLKQYYQKQFLKYFEDKSG